MSQTGAAIPKFNAFNCSNQRDSARNSAKKRTRSNRKLNLFLIATQPSEQSMEGCLHRFECGAAKARNNSKCFIRNNT
jgi:hypothetical protein